MPSSFYIYPENQELLWGLIHTIPAFAEMPEHHQMELFKHSIALFHEKEPRVYSYDKLKEINQQTLAYIIDSIKQEIKPQQQPPQQNREEILQSQFNVRQSEYEQMTKQDIPTVNFLAQKEEPISNLEELMKQQMLDRELDLPKLS